MNMVHWIWRIMLYVVFCVYNLSRKQRHVGAQLRSGISSLNVEPGRRKVDFPMCSLSERKLLSFYFLLSFCTRNITILSLAR